MASESTSEGKGAREGREGRDDKKRPVGRRKQCKFCADEAIKIDYSTYRANGAPFIDPNVAAES